MSELPLIIRIILIFLSYSLVACLGFIICALLTSGKITDLEKEAWEWRIKYKDLEEENK